MLKNKFIFFLIVFFLQTFSLNFPLFPQEVPPTVKLDVSLSLLEGEKNQGNFNVAKKYFLNSLEMSQKYNYKLGIYRSSYNLAKLYYNYKKTDTALVYLSIFINYEPESSVPRHIEMEALKFATDVFFENNRFFEASKTATKLIEIKESFFEQIENKNPFDKKELGHLCYKTARIFFNRALFDSAFYFANKALNYGNDLKDLELLGLAYNAIGAIYYQWNIQDKALENYFKALENKKLAKDTVTISITLNNIGLIFSSNRQFSLAKKSHFEALQFALKAPKETICLGYCYNCIGNYYFDLKEFDSAKIYYNLSIEAYKYSDKDNGYAFNQYNLATLFSEQGDYLNSIKIFEDIVKYYEKTGNKSRTALIKTKLSINYLSINNYLKAKSYAQEALDLTRNLKQKNIEQEIYSTLSKIYAALNNEKLALSFLQKSYELLNQLNQDKQKEIVSATELNRLEEINRYQSYIKKLENQNENVIRLIYLIALFFIGIIAIILFIFLNKIKSYKLKVEDLNKTMLLLDKTLENLNLEINNLRFSSRETAALNSKVLQPTLLKSFSLLKDLILNKSLFDQQSESQYLNYILNEIYDAYHFFEIESEILKAPTLSFACNFENIELKKIVVDIITYFSLQIKIRKIAIKEEIPDDFEVVSNLSALKLIVRDLLLFAMKQFEDEKALIISANKKENMNILEIICQKNKTKSSTLEALASNFFSQIDNYPQNGEKKFSYLELLLKRIEGKITIAQNNNSLLKISLSFLNFQENK